MQDYSRPVNLFEMVHERQLEHAYRALRRMPRYGRWRIALEEPLRFYSLMEENEAPLDGVIYCVDFMLNKLGKLEPADPRSLKAIEDWDKRHTDPEEFLQCPFPV